MAIFYDRDQRAIFRQQERFEVMDVFERISQPAHVNLLFTLRYSLPIFDVGEPSRFAAVLGRAKRDASLTFRLKSSHYAG
jgi:hypothetical protein